MFEVIGGKVGTLNNSPATKNNEIAIKAPYNSAKPTQEKLKTSVPKISVFNNIDEVIKNDNYVKSGTYVPHGNKVKNTIRFDYFETPIKIADKDYIISFDIEAFTGSNNYRTHKIFERTITKMNLTLVTSGGEVGIVPTAPEQISDSYETNLPQSNNSVNTHDTQSNENYSQKEENQQYAQEAPPQNGFYAYLKDLQEMYHTTGVFTIVPYIRSIHLSLEKSFHF